MDNQDSTSRDDDDVSGLGNPNMQPARHGIQSVDRALKLLKAMAQMSGAGTLTDLARASDMPASQAHRYLASFVNAGLVEQPHRSGHYQLGKEALNLGLIAMNQIDLVNRVADNLSALRLETGTTVLMAIWGALGPTIVRWERSQSLVATSLGLGTTLPVLNSASGLIFLSFAPRRLTEEAVNQEIALRKASNEKALDVSEAGIQELINQVRSDGYAKGRYIPGLFAISAPVLDWQGVAVVAVTLVGQSDDFSRPDARATISLRRFCEEFSAPQTSPYSEFDEEERAGLTHAK